MSLKHEQPLEDHKRGCRECYNLDTFGIGDYCPIGARLHRDCVRAVYREFSNYKEPFPNSPEVKEEMKLHVDEDTGQRFAYDDAAVDLWHKSLEFIDKSILPYIESESDNPEWWVEFAKMHGDIEPDVEKCVLEALKKNFVCIDGFPEGIMTARDAKEEHCLENH